MSKNVNLIYKDRLGKLYGYLDEEISEHIEWRNRLKKATSTPAYCNDEASENEGPPPFDIVEAFLEERDRRAEEGLPEDDFS